jgi:L-iditol 2-dehydrogenase
MEGACLHATRDIRYEKDLPKPKPGKGEVLIAIKVCGTCGSDVHLYLGDYGDMMKYPFIVGHEASGVVEELGGGVTGLKIGDRVCIEPVQPQATQMLAQYYVHRADKVHKLPDHVSLDEGAMIEPLAVAVHAVKRSGMKAGDNVLVLGAGPIGQFCLVAAKAYGAARIIVTDVKGPRLDTVSLFGADGTVNVAGLSPEESAEAVKKEFPGGKIDVVLDAVGNEASLNTACAAFGTLGTVLLV